MIKTELNSSILKIKIFTEWYRQTFLVDVTPGRKMELSCEMFGEFSNLLLRQLVTTPFGDGAWAELFVDSGSVDPVLVEGVLDEINRFLCSEDAQTQKSLWRLLE